MITTPRTLLLVPAISQLPRPWDTSVSHSRAQLRQTHQQPLPTGPFGGLGVSTGLPPACLPRNQPLRDLDRSSFSVNFTPARSVPLFLLGTFRAEGGFV